MEIRVKGGMTLLLLGGTHINTECRLRKGRVKRDELQGPL